jgi:transcriptional regulator with XRE-family HTH domain
MTMSVRVTFAGMATPLGQRIHAIWKASGLSQKEIAAAMNLHRNSIGTWMRADRRPMLDSLQRFAEATGATVIVDLDHPKRPRRIVSVSAEVADLVDVIDDLDESGFAHLRTLAQEWPHMSSERRKILAGTLATLSRESPPAAENESHSPGAVRAR